MFNKNFTRSVEASVKPECIRLRGVSQNNLKGFDLDLPLGRYIAVTGLPGETGWAVPSGDFHAFLAALTPLLAAPADRTAIAPKARAVARNHFSPASQTAADLELFARLHTTVG